MGLNLDYNPGQTALNEEEQEGLKIMSITTHVELNEFEQLNIEKAVRWTINSKPKSERILTEVFIKALHKKMYGDVWKWAGEFRRSEKNIGIRWTEIGVELKKLLDNTNFWIENKTFPEEEIAIRFKHQLVSIHCFPNGNGRHSRLMADIIMEHLFQKNFFSWRGSGLVQADQSRKDYIDALRKADKGEINKLVLFANGQNGCDMS